MPTTTPVHRLVAGTDPAAVPLLLLHGTDGSESDLLPLGQELAPAAARWAVRGTVATDGGFAFFRRLPDRRVDEVDLAARAHQLAGFVTATRDRQGVRAAPLAVGFSNGAIMAAALLLADPALLAGAILFRPLLPYGAVPDVRLEGTPILVVDGADDARRAPGDGLRLAVELRRLGAGVEHHVLPVGHALTPADRQIARAWIRGREGHR